MIADVVQHTSPCAQIQSTVSPVRGTEFAYMALLSDEAARRYEARAARPHRVLVGVNGRTVHNRVYADFDRASAALTRRVLKLVARLDAHELDGLHAYTCPA
ncbi:hypothetical protein HL658_01390 [Azospirillum sp. RWY-5-1]|uniref:Uncharacterized protein n=1 Tax=Azospirillum oleiclasticum TaxID=2735135 RepID=A0ABX2T5Y2_9PROT|nr:hypothetical protein [Azospirillum oleiclasticum]NYZ11187.1 hypothetical protein [Azospirillum oleiclasticum]NYZ18349.1 hypothetical protein [Azospirillum oleiclasticum]